MDFNWCKPSERRWGAPSSTGGTNGSRSCSRSRSCGHELARRLVCGLGEANVGVHGGTPSLLTPGTSRSGLDRRHAKSHDILSRYGRDGLANDRRYLVRKIAGSGGRLPPRSYLTANRITDGRSALGGAVEVAHEGGLSRDADRYERRGRGCRAREGGPPAVARGVLGPT